MSSRACPEAFLPLTSVVFEILVTLASGDRHGYAILTRCTRTYGRAAASGLRLTASIGRLLGDGLVEELDDRPDPGIDDERRRYYRLTHLGRRVAAAEAARLAAQVHQTATPLGCSRKADHAGETARSRAAARIPAKPFRDRFGQQLLQTLLTDSRTPSGGLVIGRFVAGAMDVVRAGLAERVAIRRQHSSRRREGRSWFDAVWQDVRYGVRRLTTPAALPWLLS